MHTLRQRPGGCDCGLPRDQWLRIQLSVDLGYRIPASVAARTHWIRRAEIRLGTRPKLPLPTERKFESLPLRQLEIRQCMRLSWKKLCSLRGSQTPDGRSLFVVDSGALYNYMMGSPDLALHYALHELIHVTDEGVRVASGPRSLSTANPVEDWTSRMAQALAAAGGALHSATFAPPATRILTVMPSRVAQLCSMLHGSEQELRTGGSFGLWEGR